MKQAPLAQVVSLIREVYKRRNPAKLGEVKDLVAKYKAGPVAVPSGYPKGALAVETLMIAMTMPS